MEEESNEPLDSEDYDTEKLMTTSSESKDDELSRKVRRRKKQELNPHVDIPNLVFCVRLVFPTSKSLKEAIKEYAIKHHRDVKLVKNDE